MLNWFGGTTSATSTVDPLKADDGHVTQNGLWRYAGKSKAFSKITYQENPQSASYYRFEVHGKYDRDAARIQLERQLERAFGASRGSRKIQIDGRSMTFSYSVHQQTNNSSPRVTIVLREIPDWAPESDSEKRKREAASDSIDDLFG